MDNTLRPTSSSRYVVYTLLHLLELLRLDISLCSRSNLLPLLRFFYPDVFQSAHHIETVVPASVVEVRFVSPKSFYHLLCGHGNERLADVEDIISKWPQ
jgi:hypothetical protein